MSGEAKDPAIKLFGKTIPLPDIPPPIIANSVDDKELVLPLNSWSLPEDKERKEEVNKDDDNEDDDDKEQLHRNGGSSDGSDATIETPPDNESDRRNHSKSNNLQDKTLKKPDKILPCPRCNSMDTKFCYYNNYNVNQPRHFCKNCQRYWTAGGTMRNVPVGAGRRNNKISSSNHYRQLTIPEQNADPNTGFPTNIPEPNWPYTWSPVPPPPDFCPPGVPIVTLFSPTPAYWVPLLPQSSSPNSSSGLNSPTLGKRSRDELTTTTVRPNGSEPVKNQISVPNTLKIYDPREAANCSIRTALSDSLGEGIFKGFQPKDYEKNHIFETDLILQANPAALSRSLKFHEAT